MGFSVPVSLASAASKALNLAAFSVPAALASAASKALNLAVEYSYGRMNDDGHWVGEVLDNTTCTADYVFLQLAFGHDFGSDPDTPALLKWFFSQQNPDGSWGLAPNYPGDISTTVETYLALKILQVRLDHPAMLRGRQYARRVGGVASVRIFTRFKLATFGLLPWSSFPQLPPQFFLVPSYCPVNVYYLSYWTRSVMIPMMVVRHHEPVYTLPKGAQADFLDELWIEPSKKNLPYYPSLRTSLWKADFGTFAFTAADKLVSFLGALQLLPLRSYALQQCLKWVLEHQELGGAWTGTLPGTYVSMLALKEKGWTVNDSEIILGLQAAEKFGTKDSAGKRFGSTIGPVWDTILMTIALLDSEHADEGQLDQTILWIKKHQQFGSKGDWRVLNPTLPPGGWGFQYSNTWYPDTDDTAAAILALVKKDPNCVGSFPIFRATEWLLGMQNRDGGWAAFDRENNKLFLNKFPLGDMNHLCDPSSEDITARILECFGLQFSHTKQIDEDLLARMKESALRAIGYLEGTQTKFGAWYGRWGSNYIYGTSNALCGLRYYMDDDDDQVRPMVDRGLAWMKSVQNSDGGWGETFESYHDLDKAGVGPSTAAQTAWGIMALLAHLPPSDYHIQRGVWYLTSRQTKLNDGYPGASWPRDCYFTGVGFPLHFWLEYELYRHYFPVMALGRFVRACRDLTVKEQATGGWQICSSGS